MDMSTIGNPMESNHLKTTTTTTAKVLFRILVNIDNYKGTYILLLKTNKSIYIYIHIIVWLMRKKANRV